MADGLLSWTTVVLPKPESRLCGDGCPRVVDAFAVRYLGVLPNVGGCTEEFCILPRLVGGPIFGGTESRSVTISW